MKFQHYAAIIEDYKQSSIVKQKVYALQIKYGILFQLLNLDDQQFSII